MAGLRSRHPTQCVWRAVKLLVSGNLPNQVISSGSSIVRRLENEGSFCPSIPASGLDGSRCVSTEGNPARHEYQTSEDEGASRDAQDKRVSVSRSEPCQQTWQMDDIQRTAPGNRESPSLLSERRPCPQRAEQRAGTRWALRRRLSRHDRPIPGLDAHGVDKAAALDVPLCPRCSGSCARKRSATVRRQPGRACGRRTSRQEVGRAVGARAVGPRWARSP